MLQPGGVNEEITVRSEAPIPANRPRRHGRKIEAVQVANAPLSYNRNFQRCSTWYQAQPSLPVELGVLQFSGSAEHAG